MLEIIGYKTEKGLYFANKNLSYGNSRSELFGSESWKRILVNGSLLIVKASNINSWYFVEGSQEINKIQTKIENERLKVIMVRNEFVVPEGINLPSELSVEEHCYFDDDDYEYIFKTDSPYCGFSNFYKERTLYKEPYYKDVEFIVEYLGEINSEFIENRKPVSLDVYRNSQWITKGTNTIDLSSIAIYDELTRLLVSDLVIHNYPCELTTAQTYEIIRHHVNTNIDSKYAFVSSNYDFCFTVQKRYQTKPIEKQKEKLTARGKSYRPPKFYTEKVDSKSIIVFEMAPKVYNKYPIVGNFKGDSLQDLADNIKTYLDELMAVINVPLCLCPHCNGTGIVSQEKLSVYK